MRPVTDKHNVSRAKLAYIIDANGSSGVHDRTDLFLGSGSGWCDGGYGWTGSVYEIYSL